MNLVDFNSDKLKDATNDTNNNTIDNIWPIENFQNIDRTFITKIAILI
jgi:hypothetical protein